MGTMSYYGGVLVVLLFAAGTCLWRLADGPVLGDHEAINAQSARESLQSGQLLLPPLDKDPWIRKPPIGAWQVIAADRLCGDGTVPPVSTFTARLPSATAGVLTALATCWLGTMLFGRRAGLIAGVIAAGSAGTIFFARNAQVDMTLACFSTLAYGLFWRGAMHHRASRSWMVLFYIALAAAMMSKAPLPMALVGLPLAVYWFLVVPLCPPAGFAGVVRDEAGVSAGWSARLVGQVRGLGRLWLIPGVVLFLVLAGAWPLYAYLRVEGALELWRIEFLDRFSGELRDARGADPWWYYIPLAIGLMAPYLFSVPEALAAVGLGWYRRQRAGLAFALTWAVVGVGFLSLSAFKQPHYLICIVPALALLLAPVVDRLFFGEIGRLCPPDLIRKVVYSVPVWLAAAVGVGYWWIRREQPELQGAYLWTALAVGVVWSLAGVLYARQWRFGSLVLLNAGTFVLVAMAWPAAGRAMNLHPEAAALSAAFNAHGIHAGSDIYWVGERPKAYLTFYGEFATRRLMSAQELARIRRSRVIVEREVEEAFARKIMAVLAQPAPAYLVIESGQLQRLIRQTALRPRVVFELSGFHHYPGEELAVITQPGPSTAPASHPATATLP